MPNVGPIHEKTQQELLEDVASRTDAGNDADITALQVAVNDLQEVDTDHAADIAALVTSVENLNTWATALATKLNVLTTKLNADAGVTDTNYATDFDTDPQA